MACIYEIFGTDAYEMTLSLMEAANVAAMIPAGASVTLKPNLVLAATPDEGATTHAGVLSGCIKYLQAHGRGDISIIESSWVGGQTERAAHTCGYDQVCKRYNVPFYDLKKDRTRRVETPLRPMDICERALDAGFLISLPVLKGHCQTVMTCALKNNKGCLPDREKRRFHSEGLMRPIAALAAALRPDLTIVDSICGDLNFEEGGNPIQTNRMYLGRDPVQLDAYGCRLMGLSVEDVPYIGFAERWGAGSMEIRPDDIITLNEPQAGKGYPSASGIVRRLTRRIREDSACSACYAALVRGLYIAQKEGISVDQDIAIGQGWRGKKFSGLGIGNCCAMAGEHIRGCPPTAAEVAEFLRAHSKKGGAMLEYNEGGWLFQEGTIQLISREVQIKDLEDLIYMADSDNQWAENVREEVLRRDQMLRGEIRQDGRIDPFCQFRKLLWNINVVPYWEAKLSEVNYKALDYSFTPNRLERINSQYGDKDLLDPVGGMLHQTPESIAYRERRCKEIFGKLI